MMSCYLIRNLKYIKRMIICQRKKKSRSKLFTVVKLSNGLTILIFAPDIEGARALLARSDASTSELPLPQRLYFLALSKELKQKVPDLKNKELTDIFADSWRNCAIEYSDAFVILANRL